MYDRWFTIALLTLRFGQVWAKLGLQKSRTTLGEIADKGSIDEYYGDFPFVIIKLRYRDITCRGKP